MNKISIVINKLKFDVRKIDNNNSTAIFLFLHGFKSFRNWGFIPYICEKIAEEGLITINLDFSLNGVISENPMQFDIEIFANNTVSQEISDVDLLISIFRNPTLWNDELTEILNNWNGKIILCGHSRGAGISIVEATKHIEIERLVLLSPIANFNRYTNRMTKKWIEQGFLEFNDPSSGQKLKLNATYIEDILNNSNKYNLKRIVQILDLPILIIQGDNDLSTPLKEGEELCENYKKNIENKRNPCNFVIIKKANHLFNSHHPFDKSNLYLDEVIKNIKDFVIYE